MAKGGSRPGAHRNKTPATVKAPAKKSLHAQPDPQPAEEKRVPLDLQQKCLDIFRDALNPGEDDSAILQEVKGHLYNRDFAAAFSRAEYLRVYASRWSPSRALAYLDVFEGLQQHLDIAKSSDSDAATRVVCLGGGAGAELVGLAAWASRLACQDSGGSANRLDVDLVDIADWDQVTTQLHYQATTPPDLSKYASQAKRDANRALVQSESFNVNFIQMDILDSGSSKGEDLREMVKTADLVTFMFTLNELYSTSVNATQVLLTKITLLMRSGSHLLVVDSPGSYSTVSLNGAEKKYPMQWLLDHTLLEAKYGSDGDEARWEKVEADESRWFRLSKELRYPILLEDMRFQLHLFRRTECG